MEDEYKHPLRKTQLSKRVPIEVDEKYVKKVRIVDLLISPLDIGRIRDGIPLMFTLDNGDIIRVGIKLPELVVLHEIYREDYGVEPHSLCTHSIVTEVMNTGAEMFRCNECEEMLNKLDLNSDSTILPA